jgi:hypothetical protein
VPDWFEAARIGRRDDAEDLVLRDFCADERVRRLELGVRRRAQPTGNKYR